MGLAEAAELAFEETTPKVLIRDKTEVKVADHFFGEGSVLLMDRLLNEKSETQLPDFSGYGGLAEKWSANGDYCARSGAPSKMTLPWPCSGTAAVP